jgi:alpha-L-rhamnosidase
MAVVKPAYLERPHLVTSHVVSGWFNEIPMWTFLWVWMAWEHYLHTGEEGALRDYYADVRTCLQRCEDFLSERDLFAIPDVWNLVDWAAQDLEPYGEVVSNTVLFAQSCRVAAQMAERLGHADEAEHFTALGARLDEAVNTYGWSETHEGYVDTVRDETAFRAHQARSVQNGTESDSWEAFIAKTRISEPTNTLALLCGTVPEVRRDAVLKFVLAAKDGQFVGTSPAFARFGSTDEVVPVGSPWFLFFTLETLFAEGYQEDAMQILKSQWQRMLDKGATTFWETFPGTLGGGHWSRSLCHGWSAAPAYFLSTQVLGVTPLEPGYRKVRIAPQTFGLTWARGQVPTPHGPIYVAWELDDDGAVKLEIDAPAACEVEVIHV